MNPVTGAVPPLIRGHGIRFEVDRWTWRRLDAARFDGERRHLAGPRRDAASNPHSRHAARTERSENPSTMASSRSASADRPTSRAPANGTRNASRAGTPRATRDR